MTILFSQDTRVVVQGITGKQGKFHTERMIDYGTNVVAGVTPGKSNMKICNVDIYDSVEDALSKKPDVSAVFVPAKFAKDAILESIDAGLKKIIVITEHIPVKDIIFCIQYAKLNDCMIIGPNTPGIIIPKYELKIGIMPHEIFKHGNVGVVSRSGTLTYEIVESIVNNGFGISACIGIGGDLVVGTSFTEILYQFEHNKDTKYIVMVGEIGGTAEEDSAEYVKAMSKSVICYIAGITAPEGKKMGHAGAIISKGKGSAKNKIDLLKKACGIIATKPTEIGKLLQEL